MVSHITGRCCSRVNHAPRQRQAFNIINGSNEGGNVETGQRQCCVKSTTSKTAGHQHSSQQKPYCCRPLEGPKASKYAQFATKWTPMDLPACAPSPPTEAMHQASRGSTSSPVSCSCSAPCCFVPCCGAVCASLRGCATTVPPSRSTTSRIHSTLAAGQSSLRLFQQHGSVTR